MSKQETTPLTLEELLDIACRMAQELTDFADEADAAGSPQPGVRALVDEFNQDYYERSGLYWQKTLHEEDRAPSLIDEL